MSGCGNANRATLSPSHLVGGVNATWSSCRRWAHARSLRVKRGEQPLVRVEDERVGLFQPPGTWAAGSGRRCPSRRMPRSPSSARTCSPTHDLFARHHDLLYYGLTAFACIRYFRHELFVNAQSFVFKLLFPLLLARFQEFDRGEAEGVGDMPIATRISAVRLNSSALSGSSGCCVTADRLSDARLRRPTWVNCSVRPARPGLSPSMDDRRWLCDDTARRQS